MQAPRPFYIAISEVFFTNRLILSYVESKLRSYTRFKREVSAYRLAVLDGSGQNHRVHLGRHHHSDPTALRGILLAEPPRRIRHAQDWARVIETAYIRLLQRAPMHALFMRVRYGLFVAKCAKSARPTPKHVRLSPAAAARLNAQICKYVYKIARARGLMASSRWQ